MDALNYIVLAVGMLAIGLFWNIIGPKERAKETRSVTIGIFIFGMVVYFLQSTLFPH